MNTLHAEEYTHGYLCTAADYIAEIQAIIDPATWKGNTRPRNIEHALTIPELDTKYAENVLTAVYRREDNRLLSVIHKIKEHARHTLTWYERGEISKKAALCILGESRNLLWSLTPLYETPHEKQIHEAYLDMIAAATEAEEVNTK